MTGVLRTEFIQDEGASFSLPVWNMQRRIIQRVSYVHRTGWWRASNTYYWVPGAYVDFRPVRSDSRIRLTFSIPTRDYGSAHMITHWIFYVNGTEYGRHSRGGHHVENAFAQEWDIASWGAGQYARAGYKVRSYAEGNHNAHLYHTEYWDGGGAGYEIPGQVTVEEYTSAPTDDISLFTTVGNSTFTAPTGTVAAEVLIVGGGGGGGMDMGGGGGGGGVVWLPNYKLNPGSSYNVTVGAGGAGAPGGSNNPPGSHQYTLRGSSGGNSSFDGQIAYGGGYGASSYWGYTPDYGQAGAGGCGGGASGYSDGTGNGGNAGAGGRYGSGTVSATPGVVQGFRGGGGTGQYYSGGGGGASGVGGSGTGGTLRSKEGAGSGGGNGAIIPILGVSYYWGGGGGGAGYSTTGGSGGYGGGGAGAVNTTYGGSFGYNAASNGNGGGTNSQTNVPGSPAGANTGGGGGGGSHYQGNNGGGNGGSGIVIVKPKKVITDRLRVHLDAGLTASYPGSGTTWYDLSGQGNHFTVNATAYNSTGPKYMDFNGSYGCAKPLSGTDVIISGDVTVCVWTRIKTSTAEWRTLLRGATSGADHHVIIQSGGYQIGMYDNTNGTGFNDSGLAQTALPSWGNSSWIMMTWRWKNDATPYYSVSYNDTPGTTRGSNNSINTRFKHGFSALGAYGNSIATDVNAASQYWGDIGAIMIYDRYLQDWEVQQNYNAYSNRFRSNDPGNGLGITAAQGSDATAVTGYTNNSMPQYKQFTDNQGAPQTANLWNYTYYGSGQFSCHTGHQGWWWPTYFAINVTSSANGKVLDQIQWIKHANACGNVDIFGTNRDIQADNWNEERLWSHLGRVHMGGYGSATDGTTITASFNPSGYGYKWYMIKVVDNNPTALAYGNNPVVGYQSGWAMYTVRLNKV